MLVRRERVLHVVHGDAPVKRLALYGEEGAREGQAEGPLRELVSDADFRLPVLYGHGVVVEADDLVEHAVANAVGFSLGCTPEA